MENPFHSQPGPLTPSSKVEDVTTASEAPSVPLLNELHQAPSFDVVETEPLVCDVVEASQQVPEERSEAPPQTAPEILEAPAEADLPRVKDLTQPASPFTMVQTPAPTPESSKASPFRMVQGPTATPAPTPKRKVPIETSRRMPKPSIPSEETAPPNISQHSVEKISSLQLLALGCLIAALTILMGMVYDMTQRDGRWVRRVVPANWLPSAELPK